MIIGIDIDDTITSTSEVIYEKIKKYENQFKGINEIKENMRDIIRGVYKTENIKRFMAGYLGDIYIVVKIKEDAARVIKILMNDGHKIYFITARTEKLFRNAKRDTLKFLEDNNVSYHMLIMDAEDKLKECRDNNVDIMIDDSVDVCEYLDRNGIKTYLFNSEVNKNISTNIPRIYNWDEAIDNIFVNIN